MVRQARHGARSTRRHCQPRIGCAEQPAVVRPSIFAGLGRRSANPAAASHRRHLDRFHSIARRGIAKAAAPAGKPTAADDLDGEHAGAQCRHQGNRRSRVRVALGHIGREHPQHGRSIIATAAACGHRASWRACRRKAESAFQALLLPDELRDRLCGVQRHDSPYSRSSPGMGDALEGRDRGCRCKGRAAAPDRTEFELGRRNGADRRRWCRAVRSLRPRQGRRPRLFAGARDASGPTCGDAVFQPARQGLAGPGRAIRRRPPRWRSRPMGRFRPPSVSSGRPRALPGLDSPAQREPSVATAERGPVQASSDTSGRHDGDHDL